MQDPATKLDDGQNRPRGGGEPRRKFTYASGSRPLEGYTIKRGIGVGGFGEVYFATSDAGKEVALKRIQRNLDIELRGVGQCINLKHVNLIDLFDIKYDDHGQGWVVMEYVNGESLKDVLDRNPNGLPPAEIEHWFSGVAAGVAYLHDQGIVHRDLKPGNIFADDDVVKIGDYGLSKFISCSRRSGQTESVGTFHYMAPEIGKGSYGREIDIYALGVILYEMITGRVPFDGESSQEIIMKHLTAEPDLTDIPAPLRSIVARALAKDPQQRFASVPEMLDELNDVQSGPESQQSTQPRTGLMSAVLPPPTPPSDAAPATDDKNETLYIDDDTPVPILPGQRVPSEREMVFGQVQQVVNAQSVGPAGRKTPPSNRPAPRQSVTGGEPIASAVGGGWNNLVAWWNNASIGTPLKVLLLVCAALLMMAITVGAPWLIPVALVVVAGYVIYYGVRELTLALGSRSETKPAISSPRQRARTRREALRAALMQRSPGERLADLTGSMLMAAVVSAVLSLIMLVVAGRSLDGSLTTWTFYTWLTFSSTAGAWTVLAAGKFWEGDQGDAIRRRFFLLTAGLGLGAAVFGGAQALMIPFTGDAPPLFVENYTSSILDNGVPQLPAYLIYFGVLLAGIRWWMQADPLRNTRLSLWGTIVSGLWGWVLPIPQPWGFMMAVTISVAVQLSAPWMSPKQRNEIGRRFLQT